MTSPRPQLPTDIKSCHALIEQLRAELRTATEQNAGLQAAVAEARDAAAQIAHLEELLGRYQATITEQEQTIESLAADNALLKRSLFGSRRERFTDDPAQALLFETSTLDSPPPDDKNEQPPEEKKKRTSKGRRPRVFPDCSQPGTLTTPVAMPPLGNLGSELPATPVTIRTGDKPVYSPKVMSKR